MSCSAYYNTEGDGGGNEKSGKAAPSQAAECDVGLVLNMQYAESTYPNKKMNFMSNPSLYHHPQYGASIEISGGNGSGGSSGGRLLFDSSTATNNQIASGTSAYTIGREMKNLIFTASQLQEFENQTMIYKHIMSSNPVPPQLLLPLSTQSNRSDSEPWRCRRTDGKKWRCSRDVMPDQKYCERHAHKNRPRSRKPVETQSQNTKNLNSKDIYHPTLHSATTMPTSCQQSRCPEWFMKSGTIPLSSTHQKIQKPMHSPSVGSKRDQLFQNLEGNHQDLVQGDNCFLTLMQPGGNDTCDDQELFQMGIGMLTADGLNPHNQWPHQGSWFGGPLGGPLGEALCPGVGSSLNPPPNVPSPHDAGRGLR